MGRAHVYLAVRHMEHIPQLIQQRVMAADDYQGVFQLVHGAQGTSRIPSAFIKEDTTPLPRLRGEAISRSPT